MQSGWQESDLLPLGPGPSALPVSYNPHVEMAGIEPATAALAKRARSIAVIPGCPQDGARGPYLDAHAVELTRCDHVPPEGW